MTKINPNSTDKFQHRHIGSNIGQATEMLNSIGLETFDELVQQTVPSKIRLKSPLNLPEPQSEHEYLRKLKEKAKKNKIFKSYIGQGYYNTHTPSVILRNIFENPGWYTQYTPYQAEIAQGRLEALLNYQTMVSDFTGLPIANASLLDEATAAAEAMILFFYTTATPNLKPIFWVEDGVFPQTLSVLKSRAKPLNITIKVGKIENYDPSETPFGVLLQYPNKNGQVEDYKNFVEKVHHSGGLVAVATDLLALTLLPSPGSWGADVALGNSQRMGVPLGFGGPHAAFFAVKESFKRNIPGRIIGLSVDSHNQPTLRMALQTREQHIRREKATSNICTAQALLAIMAGMYAVYHGAEGLRNIAWRIHLLAVELEKGLHQIGFETSSAVYFDTLAVTCNNDIRATIEKLAEQKEINLNFSQENVITIAIDETTLKEDIDALLHVFSLAKSGSNGIASAVELDTENSKIPKAWLRPVNYLQHPVFKKYHSETLLMRYIKFLENKDLSLTHSMISLGSCTMKLNAASELIPVSWPEFSQIHPFAPVSQVEGYLEIIKELEKYLATITGFAGTSLQPNSGAQGEYAGLLVIKAFQESQGQSQRNIALIPSSAHGTNPASAVMAGLKVVVVQCDVQGNIDFNDLKNKALLHKENLCCLMVTYPSTHGVFEENIQEVCEIIHQNGGQVYLDGANMNAQVGLTNPGTIGADVCHLNLHKTFAIPHGGGGPGVGPICVAAHLVPFLPGHVAHYFKLPQQSISALSAAPFGSASILLISYGYIKMLGNEGMTAATRYAILNANYIKSKLEKKYKVLYAGSNNRVAHELIIDFRGYKSQGGIEVEDIAKRLMDYGFHAPTMSFPVAGTMMIEPTESESKEELDRFCEAMLQIATEIEEVQLGKFLIEESVLRNAPHTLNQVLVENWDKKYSREKAAFPLPYVRVNKFWPSSGRVNNSYGDRNLVCTCPPIEHYATSDFTL